jgi:hypothetical protein
MREKVKNAFTQGKLRLGEEVDALVEAIGFGKSRKKLKRI